MIFNLIDIIGVFFKEDNPVVMQNKSAEYIRFLEKEKESQTFHKQTLNPSFQSIHHDSIKCTEAYFPELRAHFFIRAYLFFRLTDGLEIRKKRFVAFGLGLRSKLTESIIPTK